jgi:hypothetical protein
MGLISAIGDAASAAVHAAINAVEGVAGHVSSGSNSTQNPPISPEQEQMNALQAQAEASNITTGGYRKIQNASEDVLFFLQEWQGITNAREENDHAASLGLEPPNVNTSMPEGIFGEDNSDDSHKAKEDEAV